MRSSGFLRIAGSLSGPIEDVDGAHRTRSSALVARNVDAAQTYPVGAAAVNRLATLQFTTGWCR